MPTRRKAPSPPLPPEPVTKLEQVIAALKAPAGATIPDLVDLTGWQSHSVRGFIAGNLKKKRRLEVVSAKVDGQRVYRIEEPSA